MFFNIYSEVYTDDQTAWKTQKPIGDFKSAVGPGEDLPLHRAA